MFILDAVLAIRAKHNDYEMGPVSFFFDGATLIRGMVLRLP